MNTSYVDLYYGFQGLSEPAQLTDELKQWVESAKERKLIKFSALAPIRIWHNAYQQQPA